MHVWPHRMNNHYVPKAINHVDVYDTETHFDSCDSDDDPKAASELSSANNTCDVEIDDDSNTTAWWISPEDDEGWNSQHGTESQVTQSETAFKEFLRPGDYVKFIPRLEDCKLSSFIVDLVKNAEKSSGILHISDILETVHTISRVASLTKEDGLKAQNGKQRCAHEFMLVLGNCNGTIEFQGASSLSDKILTCKLHHAGVLS